eukprot:7390113-Prymnesium_polylepis.1
MWAVVRRRSRPASRTEASTELRTSTHTPTHPQHPTPQLASPEGLSHLPEHRWWMPGPHAHWEGGARAGDPCAVTPGDHSGYASGQLYTY